MNARSQRAAAYGTAIVLFHLLINLVHGAAHRELHIDLGAPETVFVAVVILAGPLLAMTLLWTAWQRLGLGLLALTMAGSLVFGLYHHFVAMGPDHVGAQAAGFWGTAFEVTAGFLLLAEAVGTYLGLRYLYRTPAAV
jgi:hypothetical protein